MKTLIETQKDKLVELGWKELINAIKPRDISVSVNNGVVTLFGTVTTYSRKAFTEQIVADIKGVKSIVNRLEVKLLNADHKSDEELKGDILDTLFKTTSLSEENRKKENRTKHHPALITKDEMAYWEIFT